MKLIRILRDGLGNRSSETRCSRTESRLNVFLPETLDGPVVWDIPADRQEARVSVRIEGPQAGQRNGVLLEVNAAEYRASMRSEDAARAAVSAVMQGLAGVPASDRGRFRALGGLAAGVILSFAAVAMIGIHQSGTAAASQLVPVSGLQSQGVGTVAPGQPTPGTAMQKVTVDAEGLQLLKRIRATNGIALGPITDRSHVLYVFADPNCPHCRASEKTIERLGPDVVAVVMPVAFLPGSDISAASAMCSKDTASAWRQVTAGMPPRDAMNCKAGSDIVTANTKLFDGVGFQYTPTFVSDTGKIAIGEASAQELRDLFH